MRKYELIVVLNGSLSEADVKSAQTKYEELLSSSGAKELSSDYWGRREVAYEVKKAKYGHYVCFYFESGESNTISDVNDALRIEESVLLFQAHRLSERYRKFKGRLAKDEEASAGAGA